MKYFFITCMAIALIVGFVVSREEALDNKANIGSVLRIASTTLNIGIADTNTERAQGLSGRVSLGENEGLLFVFEKEGGYGFWMKDMNIPIDIAWLDKDKAIIHIENAVSPATYPQVFYPPSPSLYVLEANSDFFHAHDIKIGDKADF